MQQGMLRLTYCGAMNGRQPGSFACAALNNWVMHWQVHMVTANVLSSSITVHNMA
jgi:hypothetical protein